ncbi:IclR family transcriptional regulator [Facklamia sp. DSM 111018]|uniref:IclR family transcriptional regulator n=1 Tax=Facklamia lactis TaxID=2749967 RepID=A0ABS0LQ54_9LACT|nr:IclR family transcriptional regulator [Facklamia lactis]MBG9980336.1 IclR family transcriptional regulator [Facklamia lactis]MBG9986139.1 IclR family transcriptional regulator [Facklamia lactis]
MTEKKDSGILDSVSNALRILKSYSHSQPVKRVNDIAKELNVSKSTASRLVKTLAAEGFLTKDTESAGYRLGKMTLTLGGIFANSNEIYREMGPVLNEIVSETKESAHLAVIIEKELVYLMKYVGPYYADTKIDIGETNPLHATSSGKVLLAYGDSNRINEIKKEGLDAYTEHTITNPILFEKELLKIRRNGYAVSMEEYTYHNFSIAAPVFNIDGEVVCAIGMAAPTSRLKQNKLPNLIKIIVNGSKIASELLGWDG